MQEFHAALAAYTYYYYYTFAAAGGAGATRCVTGAAFKEVNVVGFSIGLHTRSAPINCNVCEREI